MNKIFQIGNLRKSKPTFSNPQCGRVYSADGLAPTINCMGGGSRQPMIIVRRHSYVGFDWRDAKASSSKI